MATEDYDRTIQRFQMLYALSCLIFSPLPGIIADADGGSYTPAFVLFLIMGAFVAGSVQVCILSVKKKRQSAGGYES